MMRFIALADEKQIKVEMGRARPFPTMQSTTLISLQTRFIRIGIPALIRSNIGVRTVPNARNASCWAKVGCLSKCLSAGKATASLAPTM